MRIARRGWRTAGWRDRGGAPCGVSTDGNARPAFMPQVDQRAGRALRLGGASLVTNPCEKRASLRSRPVAHPRCPRSSGGNSERDGRRASPFGFGRTTGSPPLARANRPARHTASLPSSLPVCLSVLAALCALRTGRTWSRMTATGCEVVHRRKNLLELRTERQAGVSGISRNEATGFVSGAVL